MTDPQPGDLQPTDLIDSQHSAIRTIVDDLRQPDDTLRAIAVRLFYYVRDRIRYNPFVPLLVRPDYRASVILERGEGFCVQKAVLLAALARCARIPARLCFADLRNHLTPEKLLEAMGTDLFTYHGYTLLYLKGRWVKATPAFDRAMCDKHDFVPVEFNGEADAVFHPRDRQGRLHIEYLRQIGCYDDVPFDDIMATFKRVYGEMGAD